jgi:hypothetical protein
LGYCTDSAEPGRKIPRIEVGITLEHLQGFMSRHGGDLHDVQALLEKATGSLVAQIMKSQARDTGPSYGAPKRELEGVRGELRKDAARGRGRKRAQDTQGPAGERYASALSVLGEGQ